MGNDQTPAYAIFEDGLPTRVALFNYMTDPTGAHDYTAFVQLSGQVMATEVYVRCVLFVVASRVWW